MKVRDSGMPDEATWERFFDAGEILAALAFTDPDMDVIDLGCGYGTFTIAAARLTKGMVYAVDIDVAMIEATAARAAALGLQNVKTIERDFIAEGTGLPDDSTDYAMLFNILHAQGPVGLLREAFRSLRPGGKVAVIHWVHDTTTPRGPDLSIRPRPQQCRQWLQEAGFELLIPQLSLPPHHYGVVGHKPQKR
jgi:ubiquinone/menaquinone biosynthesis C-methylase UbiE